MSLQEQIAEVIADVFTNGGPAIYDQAAAAVLALLRKEADDTTWYCARFGIAAYEPDICARYGHEGCGQRFIVDLAAVGEGETP